MNKCDACRKCIKHDFEKDNSLRCSECKEIDEPVYLKRKMKAEFKYNWLTMKYERVNKLTHSKKSVFSDSLGEPYLEPIAEWRCTMPPGWAAQCTPEQASLLRNARSEIYEYYEKILSPSTESENGIR